MKKKVPDETKTRWVQLVNTKRKDTGKSIVKACEEVSLELSKGKDRRLVNPSIYNWWNAMLQGKNYQKTRAEQRRTNPHIARELSEFRRNDGNFEVPLIDGVVIAKKVETMQRPAPKIELQRAEIRIVWNGQVLEGSPDAIAKTIAILKKLGE